MLVENLGSIGSFVETETKSNLIEVNFKELLELFKSDYSKIFNSLMPGVH